MTSREAFEAWYFGNPITPSHAADKGADGQYKYAAAHTAWNVWQAATDRARDVAAEIVLRELDDNGQARAINDAIKEALK